MHVWMGLCSFWVYFAFACIRTLRRWWMKWSCILWKKNISVLFVFIMVCVCSGLHYNKMITGKKLSNMLNSCNYLCLYLILFVPSVSPDSDHVKTTFDQTQDIQSGHSAPLIMTDILEDTSQLNLYRACICDHLKQPFFEAALLECAIADCIDDCVG